MSINQGERFSNERYLTMSQVSKTLGTTLIDDIWKEVLSYRNAFMTTIPLRTVERNRLKVVLTPKINDRMNQLDRRLYRVQIRLNELMVDPHNNAAIKTLLYRDVLKTVARSYDIEFNESIVNQLINNTVSVLTPREMFLNDYFRGLAMISHVETTLLDEKYLADVGRLFNVPPLNNYVYRTTDVKMPRQVSLINHIHSHVPINQIVDSINDFFAFLEGSSLPSIALTATVLFYLDYIKPFEIHSELIAVLFAKTLLAKSEFSLIAPFINFELLLEKYKEYRDDIFMEVKKSSDLTYFIDLFINVINETLETIEERIAYVLTHKLEEEKHIMNDGEAKEITPPSDLFAYAIEAEREVRQPMPVFTPKPGAIVLPKEEPKEVFIKPEEANLGVDSLPVVLSENDILRLERHLREKDPSLTRAAAYFYARHCTIGKYYTINDFKEVTGCAYETARTSMDHLANSGYYRKEKFKNKFLYTPIKKERIG